MGRKQIPLRVKIDRGIIEAGDHWLQRQDDKIYCQVCKRFVNYTENNIYSRIDYHLQSKKHWIAAAKAGRGLFNPSESSDDEDEPLPTHTNKANANVKVYDPRTPEDIAACLAHIAKEETGGGSDENSLGDGLPIAGPGAVTGASNRTKDDCWKYMRLTNRRTASGKDMYECIFCNYEGSAHITAFKYHFCHSCPGIPDEIKQSIKRDGKTRGLRFVKKKAQRGHGYMDLDDSDLEESGEADCELDSHLSQSKALEILTRLLDQRDFDVESDDEQEAPEEVGTGELTVNRTTSKKRKLDTDDSDIDRQIKEVELKKKKAELRLINEKIESEVLIKRDAQVRIEERKERTKLYQSINKEFPCFLSVMKLISTWNQGASVNNLNGATNSLTGGENTLGGAFTRN